MTVVINKCTRLHNIIEQYKEGVKYSIEEYSIICCRYQERSEKHAVASPARMG